MGKVPRSVLLVWPRRSAETPHQSGYRLAHSNGNHVRYYGWHVRNVRPVTEDELQRVLTFWQGDQWLRSVPPQNAGGDHQPELAALTPQT